MPVKRKKIVPDGKTSEKNIVKIKKKSSIGTNFRQTTKYDWHEKIKTTFIECKDQIRNII